MKGEIDINKKSDIFMFNSLFILQYMLGGRKRAQVKYKEYPLANAVVGIGGLLIQTSWIIKFAEELVIEVVHNGDTIGKFKVSDLTKYYKLDFSKPEIGPYYVNTYLSRTG